MKPRRISLAKARIQALPIMLSGYKKRSQARSAAEVSLRAPEKVTRDIRNNSKPHLCSI